jgi:hypothetical protein
MKEKIDSLRKQFPVLYFFTDIEIENIWIFIRSKCGGTKNTPQEILTRLDRAWQTKVGNC